MSASGDRAAPGKCAVRLGECEDLTVTDRGAARLRTVLIVLVVLLAALVGADRAGEVIAGHVAGDTIETSQHLRSRPDVDIGGFPFLTQLASGRFEQITVTAHGVPVDRNADRLDLTRVQIVLHHVSVTRDFSAVRAGSATATALVSFAELSKRLKITVGFGGNGRITASKKFTILGNTVDPAISAQPQLHSGTLVFGAVRVTGLGAIGQQLAGQLAGVFALKLPLGNVPFHVRASAVTVTPSGLGLVLTGANLSYAKP